MMEFGLSMNNSDKSLEKGKGLYIGTGLSSSKEYSSLLKIIGNGLDAGIRSFDTAPSYNTETLLGAVLQECTALRGLTREELYIQTKIDPWQMQESNGQIEKYVFESLHKMKLTYFDAIFVHWPIPEYLENTLECLQKLKAKGLICEIGVCNVRTRHLEKMIEWGLAPNLIQIERHPLRTCAEEIEFCTSRNIGVQAYSPLCKMNSRIQNSQILAEIADIHKKSIGQIILRWHIDSGTVPIFTSTKADRIREYSDIFDFALSEKEIASISSLNINYKMYLESWLCPGF